MKKVVLAAVVAAFTVSVGTVTIAMAKDAPGKCGTFNYFDKKTKKCKSKM